MLINPTTIRTHRHEFEVALDALRVAHAAALKVEERAVSAYWKRPQPGNSQKLDEARSNVRSHARAIETFADALGIEIND